MLTYFPLNLLALIAALICIFTVQKSQTGEFINTTKIYIYILLSLFLPILLIKPDIYIFDPNTNYRSLFLPSAETINKTIIVFSLMCISFALSNIFSFNFFKNRDQKKITEHRSYNKKNFLVSYCDLVYIFLVVLTIINIDYRITVIRYVFGNFDYDTVNALRRFQNNDLAIINSLRYSLIFIHILLFSLMIKRKFGFFAFFAIYFFSIILISGNISKLYYIFAIAAFIVASIYDSKMINFLYDQKFFLKLILASFPMILILAIIVSYVEHPGSIGFIDGLRLGFYRIFVSSWNDMAYFIELFPESLEFTYFRQSSLISNIFSLDFIPIGVLLIDSHPDLYGKHTTIASFFVAYAWAFGGYSFVFLFTFMFGFLLKYLDIIHHSFNSKIIKTTFYSFIIVSPISNLQASFFSSLLHYGLLLVPLYLMFLDKFISKKDKIL